MITADLDRLGRDALRNSVLLDQLINKQGLRVFYYQTTQEEFANSPEQRLCIGLRSLGAEMERAKAEIRSRDVLTGKARSGYVTGGHTYGYRNQRIFAQNNRGEEVGSHTEAFIDEDEAWIVNAIFLMYRDGHGYTTIARTLNGDSDAKFVSLNAKYLNGKRPPSPKRGNRGSGSWSTSAIQPMLKRERYIGKIVYGATRTKTIDGERKSQIKQEKPLVTVEIPSLRIVDQALWDAVQARIAANGESYNRPIMPKVQTMPDFGDLMSLSSKVDTVDTGRDSPYLLTGLLRCGVCGGNIVVLGGKASRQDQDQRTYRYYGCSRNRGRGTSVCANDYRVTMLRLDHQMLALVRDSVLAPDTQAVLVDRIMERVSQAGTADHECKMKAMESQHQRIEKELDNFMAMISSGSHSERIASEVEKREMALASLSKSIGGERELIKQHGIDRQTLLAMVVAAVENIEGALNDNLASSRKALREMLKAPLLATPAVFDDKKTFLLSGSTEFGAFLKAGSYANVASPRGFEPRLSP